MPGKLHEAYGQKPFCPVHCSGGKPPHPCSKVCTRMAERHSRNDGIVFLSFGVSFARHADMLQSLHEGGGVKHSRYKLRMRVEMRCAAPQTRSQSCMRRREQVASSKDDNILAARKDEHTVSERLESCCNGLREFRGHLQVRRKSGSLPTVT